MLVLLHGLFLIGEELDVISQASADGLRNGAHLSLLWRHIQCHQCILIFGSTSLPLRHFTQIRRGTTLGWCPIAVVQTVVIFFVLVKLFVFDREGCLFDLDLDLIFFAFSIFIIDICICLVVFIGQV